MNQPHRELLFARAHAAGVNSLTPDIQLRPSAIIAVSKLKTKKFLLGWHAPKSSLIEEIKAARISV
jgi:hypothetical protein